MATVTGRLLIHSDGYSGSCRFKRLVHPHSITDRETKSIALVAALHTLRRRSWLQAPTTSSQYSARAGKISESLNRHPPFRKLTRERHGQRVLI